MLKRLNILKKENKNLNLQNIKEKEYVEIKRKYKARFYFERAGIYTNERVINKILFNVSIAFNLIISAYLLFIFSGKLFFSWVYILFIILLLWVIVFPIVLFLVWLLFYMYLELRVYKRRIEIESVLPDFLQLVASNIRAGMLIDKALWYAVRPRFGILANEIEIVAKETMVGKDIKLALTQFGERYDSIVLKRTISLIMEGMDAGGNLGELINKIAVDIEEAKVLQREMSANVSNYVIFIGFASIVAAPVLFALGHQFLGVIQKLALNTDLPKGVGPLSSISFSGTGISSGSFTIFAFTSLTVTAFFSALIVGVIKKGDAKSSVKYIPIFIIVALVIFYVVDKGLSSALANFF